MKVLSLLFALCPLILYAQTPAYPVYDHLSRSNENKHFGTAYDSQLPVIGGENEDEGRYVAFVSYAAGLDNSTGRKRQIFWRDRKTGITRLISRGMNGEEGNGDSNNPSISGDGLSVAFESQATNLVPIDNNKVRDVFVWNASTNTITAVSDQAGMEANGESYEPSISGKGSWIAFTSSASNLAPGVDGTSMVNVYLKNMQTGIVQLLTKDPFTGKALGGSAPSISYDGDRVAFCSFASKLVENDRNGLWDIFVYDRSWPQLKRVSLAAGGGERLQGDESASRIVSPSISGNGKFVVFSTTAPNVVPYDENKKQDVFIVDVETLRVLRLSLNNDAVEGDGDSPIGQGERIAVSHNAKWIAFTTRATNFGVPPGNIVMKNLVTGEMKTVTSVSGREAGRPSISRTAAYVAFGIGALLDNRYSSSGLFAWNSGVEQ